MYTNKQVCSHRKRISGAFSKGREAAQAAAGRDFQRCAGSVSAGPGIHSGDEGLPGHAEGLCPVLEQLRSRLLQAQVGRYQVPSPQLSEDEIADLENIDEKKGRYLSYVQIAKEEGMGDMGIQTAFVMLAELVRADACLLDAS
eukprot:10476769-Alexandrium_andersonii.AAC.1